jgi:hypothetical protein
MLFRAFPRRTGYMSARVWCRPIHARVGIAGGGWRVGDGPRRYARVIARVLGAGRGRQIHRHGAASAGSPLSWSVPAIGQSQLSRSSRIPAPEPHQKRCADPLAVLISSAAKHQPKHRLLRTMDNPARQRNPESLPTCCDATKDHVRTGSFYIGALAGWNIPEPSASSSARITCTTALISARWVNACGKLPRCRPDRGSISSA